MMRRDFFKKIWNKVCENNSLMASGTLPIVKKC